MKPIHAAVIFAVILFAVNFGMDQLTEGKTRPLMSLIIGAVAGGAAFGLVMHLWARRKASS